MGLRQSREPKAALKGVDAMSDSKNKRKSLLTSERRSNLLPFVKDSQSDPREEAPSIDYSTAHPITDDDIEPLPPEDWLRIYREPILEDESCFGREATAELRPEVEQVETADDFSQFAQHMLADLGDNWDAWMNTCIHSFIDALGHAAAHLAHSGRGNPPRQPSWKLFAATLYAARFYGTSDFEDWVEEFIDGLFVEGGDSAVIN
jgi:hypothetical protein